MTIQPQDIDSLIELFETSDWDELHLKMPDFEIFLSTDSTRRVSGSVPIAAAVGASIMNAGSPAAVPARAAPMAGPTSASLDVPANWLAVTAPNLGTFYRAPKPGSPPFVEIDQAVEPETDICLIEVMKLFTTLKAGSKGIVRRVCVKDAAMVEFGETLFYIEPS
jgi:acetyl-CoA carboxylase biotin carboxyl carrier protein